MDQDLVSFVLRFVREAGEDQQARWRGVVKHVQSNSESSFTQFAQAIAFMQSHVNEIVQAGYGEAARVGKEFGGRQPLTEAAQLWGEYMPPFARAMLETMEEAWNKQVGDQGVFKMSDKDNPFEKNLELWQQFSDSYTKNMFSMFEKNVEQSQAFQEQVQEAVTKAVDAQFKMVMTSLETMGNQVEELTKRMAEMAPGQPNGKAKK